jgi:Putative MetA-pathway of phenol degradation
MRKASGFTGRIRSLTVAVRERFLPRLAAATAFAAALSAPAVARAQACCAGATALSPGRLILHESALVGVQTVVTGITGSFDQSGAFVPAPKGTVEVDFTQNLIATLRVLERGQITVIVPLVETYRHDPVAGTPGITDGGGGIGDIQVAARWDATLAGSSLVVPGIAVLAALTLPTGLPPDLSNPTAHPLASDATGTGAVQGSVGLSLEQTFGHVLVNLTGSATLHTARTVSGMRTELGPSFNAFTALGYSFDAGPVAALTASYTGTLDNELDGATSPDTARTQLRLGVSVGHVFTDAWRVQGGVFLDPPAAHFGEGQPAGAGFSATLFRTW